MTKGQMESRISETVIKFEKEYMGRGPTEARTYIIDDIVLVRLKGVLTPAETHLSNSAEGAELIKRTRERLIEISRSLIENMVVEITSCAVKSLHTDISTKTGERIIVFVLDQNLDNRLKQESRTA
jgi:uncharacterized protein YbcI